MSELDDEEVHDNPDTQNHRKDEGDVFWNEEAGILFKWGLFWANKLLNQYDPEYGKLVLDEHGDYSIIKMLQWIVESEWQDYFSEKTLAMFGTLIFNITEEDFNAAKETEEAWEAERKDHFWKNLRPFEWINFGMDACLYFFVMKKWNGNESYFGFVPWAIIGSVAVILQMVFFGYFNNLWAEGNILLIVLQLFTLIQFVDSLLLMWDNSDVNHFIVYRILRYIFLALAALFNMVFIGGFINLMELVYSGEIFDYDENLTSVMVMKSDLGD